MNTKEEEKREAINILPICSHENEMGREGEEENLPNLDQEVEEEERKRLVSLVVLEMPPIPTCKKREMKKSEEEDSQ